MRSALVIAQVAMALVLLVSAVLMIRTFAALRNVDPGFSNPAHIQTLRVAIPPSLIADRIMMPQHRTALPKSLLPSPAWHRSDSPARCHCRSLKPTGTICS